MNFLSLDGSQTPTFQTAASIQLHTADLEQTVRYENMATDTS